MTPFRRLPFDALPELPPRPHPFAACIVHRGVVTGPGWAPVRTTWRTYGGGPPLLLVHGLMTAGYSWRYVLEPLGRRFTLVIPDLPGAGDSEPVAGPYTADRLSDWLGAFVGGLGLRGVPTIGNSLGGYLAMRLALRDPGALGPLVNLHSPGMPLFRLRALHWAMSVPGAPRLLRFLVHRDPEGFVHRNVHYYDESLKSREETRTWAAPLRSDDGVRAFGEILRDTLAPADVARFVAALEDRRAAGTPFPVPLLLVYAETDPMVPPWIGRALHDRIPGSSFVALPEASHFAHVDAVDRFLPPVEAFFDAHPGGARSAGGSEPREPGA